MHPLAVKVTEGLDTHGIDTLGHVLHTESVRKDLEGRYSAYKGKFPEFISIDRECSTCGTQVRFSLADGPGSPILVISRAVELPPEPPPLDADADAAFQEWVQKLMADGPEDPTDFRCPWEVIEPVTLRFTSTSGRVVLGNDFRKPIAGYETLTPFWRYKGERGTAQFIRQRAARGYLTGPVGNTHIWFVCRDDTLQVIEISGPDLDDSLWDRLDREAIHSVSTELWWFAIVEADLIPPGSTDSFDRPLVVFDLPGGPGEYEFVYHHQRVFHAWDANPAARQEPPGELCWATLRKVTP